MAHQKKILLDIIVPTYNRPEKLYNFLNSAQQHFKKAPNVRVVIIDDGSDKLELVQGKFCSAQQVVRLFPKDFVYYIKNNKNMGLAASLCEYYKSHCHVPYTILVNDKDVFINSSPVLNAIKKLEANPKVSMVMIPFRQKDGEQEDRPLSFNYSLMSGKEFISFYIKDANLQQAGGYAVMRVSSIRQASVPRNLNLRAFDLEDAFGVDIDLILRVASIGPVEFENDFHIRRNYLGGLTQRYPLKFAYCYYQYAKRLMRDLYKSGHINKASKQKYLAWWHLLMLRGLVVVHQNLPGTEEKSPSSLKKHLKIPFVFYLIKEMLFNKTKMNNEIKSLLFYYYPYFRLRNIHPILKFPLLLLKETKVVQRLISKLVNY